MFIKQLLCAEHYPGLVTHRKEGAPAFAELIEPINPLAVRNRMGLSESNLSAEGSEISEDRRSKI